MLRHYLLLLPCFTCTIWALTLFLNRKRNTQSQNIWMILMILMAGAAYAWGVFYSGIGNYRLYYKLDVVDTAFTLYLFPLSHFYFKSLTGVGWFGWKEMIRLLPGALIGIISIVLYLVMGDENAAGYTKEVIENYGELETYTAPVYKIHFFVNMVLFYVVLTIQVLEVLVFGTIQTIRSRGYLRAFFNNTASEVMKQNRVVLIGMWVLLLIMLTAFLGEYFLSIDFHGFAHYFMGITGVVFFYLCYIVYNRPLTLPVQTPASRSPYIAVALPGEAESEESTIVADIKQGPTLLERFNLLMEEEVYLKKHLRIEDVADMIYTNRTYISKLVKEEFGCGFAEFINRKRIEYACTLMRANPQLTQEQIAERVGFTHSSSFSRVFKQYTGFTFREVQK